MQNSRFSFGNLFDQTQISKISPATHHLSQSQQSYKQKYLQCKQNIKKFMQMVQKQFESLNQKHHQQKQTLRKQIIQLKSLLNQKNHQVSQFTVRSNKLQNSNSKSSLKNRNNSQQPNQTCVVSFSTISGFDQSKIHSRSKSMVDKNFSTLSAPNTLLQFQSALNYKNKQKLNSTTQVPLGNLTQNDISNNELNLTQYSKQIIGQRKRKIQEYKNKQNFDALMQKMIQNKITSQKEKEKSFFKVQQENISEKALNRIQKNNKQNTVSSMNNKIDQKSKSQQTSVRNILKNLRTTMKSNIQKESNLQGTSNSKIKC